MSGVNEVELGLYAHAKSIDNVITNFVMVSTNNHKHKVSFVTLQKKKTIFFYGQNLYVMHKIHV